MLIQPERVRNFVACLNLIGQEALMVILQCESLGCLITGFMLQKATDVDTHKFMIMFSCPGNQVK